MSIARARALVLVAVLVVAAAILALVAVLHDRQSNASYGSGKCPPGAVKVVTWPLPDPDQVKINVFNGTDRSGLANQVAEEFRNRGFTVVKVGNAPHSYDGTALLAYGPKEVAAAAVVNSYFIGLADTSGFDSKRNDGIVDVTIGNAFRQLGSKTDVHQAQAAIGNPAPPPGTCKA